MIAIDKLKHLKEKTKNLFEQKQVSSFDEIEVLFNEIIDDISNNSTLNSQNLDNKKYKSSFEKSIVGKVLLDKEGNYIDINPQFTKITGYSGEDVINKKIGRITHPDDVHIVLNAFEIAKTKAHSELNTTIRINSKSGDIVWIKLGTNAYHNDNNELEVIFVELYDITDIITKELELQASEKKYRDLFEANFDGISLFGFDENGKPDRFIDFNENAATMLGYTPEELKQISPLNLEITSNPDLTNNRISTLMGTGQLRFETQLAKKDSTPLDVEVLVKVIDYNGGKALVNITRDISERKKNQLALEHSENKLKTIVNALPDLVFHFDQNSKYVAFYQERDDLYLSPDQFIGKSVYEIFDKHLAEKFDKCIKETFEKGSSYNSYSLEMNGSVEYYAARYSKLNDEEIIAVVSNITRNKLNQISLKDNEQKFRAIIQYSPFAILLTNEKGIIIDCNEKFVSLTGFSKESVLDNHIIEYHRRLIKGDKRNTADFDKMKNLISRLYSDDIKLPLSYVSSVYVKNERKYLEQTIFKININEGFLIASFSNDITQKVQIEESLRSSEAFLKTTINSITQPFYVINTKDYTIALANSKLGGDKSIGKKCYEVTHLSETPCNTSLHPCPLHKVTHTKKPVTFEHMHYDEDGSPRNVEIHSFPIFDDEGNVSQIIEHMIDITEKKETEKALKEINERYDLAIKGSYNGIFDWDIINNIVYFSPQWKQQLGYEDHELVNKFDTFTEHLHPDDQESTFEFLDKYLSGENRGYDLEFRMRHKNGSYRWIRVIGTALRDENGKPYRMSGSHTDITEKKEKEIIISNQNEQLKQLNAEKDKFFSIIAHDLRSPLGGIMSLTSIINEEYDKLGSDEIKNMLFTINRSSKNVFTLLENLLEWSRLQRGLIPFHPEEYNIFDIISEATIDLINNAIKKEISFKIDVDENLTFKVDKQMMLAIIRNITSNAIKFSNKGDKVTISANVEHNSVLLTVSDTGIGMSDSIKNNIFNIEVNTSRKGTHGESSSGLGLIICKEFIDKHDGKIWVESKLGEWTKFSFSIPK